MLYFLPNYFIILTVLSTIISIIIGRKLCRFMNNKYELKPSKAEFIIWLLLPLIGGVFTLIAFLIVIYIESDKKKLKHKIETLFHFIRISK